MDSKVIILCVFLIFIAANNMFCAACNKENEMEDTEMIDNFGDKQLQIKRLHDLSRMLLRNSHNKLEFEGKRYQPQIRLGKRFHQI
jgi:hypothetical protein